MGERDSWRTPKPTWAEVAVVLVAVVLIAFMVLFFVASGASVI